MIMKERINVAELLKDCPKGMELDCTMWDNVKFSHIDMTRYYPISITIEGAEEHLTKYGQWSHNPNSKCVIFPKGKASWEGFVPPCKFKDGDIVINASNQNSNAFIYAGESNYYYYSYVGLKTGDFQELSTDKNLAWVGKNSRIRFATEDEKEKLFKAIKDNGYKWNTETKTLEKLIVPKFKVGDRIVCKNGITKPFTISKVGDNCYYVNDINAVGIISLVEQDNYELVPNKFDITTLIPFESRVLVRDSYSGFWMPTFWGVYETEKSNEHQYRNYLTTKGFFRHCIPYNDDTKHLVGKTDDCDEYYKTWE